MAKEELIPVEEVIVRAPQDPHVHSHTNRNDTKTVVIAVGASLVLFVIGLILGYLLGHQAADTDGRGMMNGNSSLNSNSLYRNRLQTQSTTN